MRFCLICCFLLGGALGGVCAEEHLARDDGPKKLVDTRIPQLRDDRQDARVEERVEVQEPAGDQLEAADEADRPVAEEPVAEPSANTPFERNDATEEVTVEEVLDFPLPLWSEAITFAEKVDWIHDWLFMKLQAKVRDADHYFLKPEDIPEPIPVSKFRLQLYVDLQEEDGFQLQVDPDYSIDLNIPNIEKKTKLFITGTPVDELPGTKPTERDRELYFGLGRMLEDSNLRADIGVKTKWLPVAFTELRWQPFYRYKGLRISPDVRGFWFSDEGFGEVTSLGLANWLSRHVYVHSGSSMRWTEYSNGVEWSQSGTIAYVWRLLREEDRGRGVRRETTSRGIGIRGIAFGHKAGSGIVDKYRLSLVYRQPIYKKWLYMEIAPQMEWRNDRDWDPVPILTFGLDALFWGVEKD